MRMLKKIEVEKKDEKRKDEENDKKSTRKVFSIISKQMLQK